MPGTKADEPDRDTENEQSRSTAPEPLTPVVRPDAPPPSRSPGPTRIGVASLDEDEGRETAQALSAVPATLPDPPSAPTESEADAAAPAGKTTIDPPREDTVDAEDGPAPGPHSARAQNTILDGTPSVLPEATTSEPETAPEASGGPLRNTMPDALDAEKTSTDSEGEEPREPLAPTMPPAPPKKRRNWLYIAIGSLFLTALIGPVAWYFVVWRYRPTAPHHIPAGTTIAVRFDGRELYLYEPFRKNVLGSFDGSEKSDKRAAKLKKLTGVDLKTDVREVIFATKTADSWIVLIGGNFDTGRSQKKFATGLKTFLDEEGVPGYTVEAGVVKGPVLRIAQAEDGTILIANNDEILRAAMDPGDAYKDLGLSSSEAMSFVVDRAAFDGLSKQAGDRFPALQLFAPDKVTRLSEACQKTQKMTGFLSLSKKDPKLTADIVPVSGEEPAALSSKWETVQSDAKQLGGFLPEVPGVPVKESLEAVKFKPRNKSVLVTIVWEKKTFDAALADLGKKLRETFGD